ncbi:hypothetical protein PBRA_007050 [Plasmodiophora brassicae]|uniref:Uncharacterized protein n=1 Tax=Plasmodiophora brassicae TaxID=37360 RepID=A0A0G4IV00_PLABS|nr:hypothetical protein PBRA_007050 [Plasmodiophora brassicae]
MRPALLENDAHSNVQEFNAWRDANFKEYLNELRFSDFLWPFEIIKELVELQAPNINPTIFLDNMLKIASNRAKGVTYSSKCTDS